MQYNKNFLRELDKVKNKVIYARITKLTFDERPVEFIEGKTTGGTISLDGASALRRACSLSLLANDIDQIDFYCGLHTKFKLEIGVENNINNFYPNIIWFNQGIYLTTGFSTSKSSDSFTISINGKDKMCLLNGDIGGTIESDVDFGKFEEEDIFGNWVTTDIPIKDIIRNIVHIYGKEPHHNIIINDLEDYGAELLEYRYDIPLYLYREKGTATDFLYTNAMFSSTTGKYKYKKPGGSWSSQSYVLDDIPQDCFESLSSLVDNDEKRTEFKEDSSDGIIYYFTRISFGEVCGYRITDLIFPGELTAKAGESITSILDKIKNILVEFEYFYNTDGQFIFQKKASTLSAMQNLNPEEKNVFNPVNIYNDTTYTFSEGETLISLNNNPNLLNLKNDYSLWGERVTASGAAVPIHLRFAIDDKPIQYTTIEVEQAETSGYANKHNIVVSPQTSKTYIASDHWEKISDTEFKCDWREVLYRMAADYYKYNFLETFYQKVTSANENKKLYSSGVTGYENYYIDIYGFWRQLYDPCGETLELLKKSLEETEKQLKNYTDKENPSSSESSIITYLEEKRENLLISIESYEQNAENYYSMEDNTNKKRRCWNKYVFEQSYNLNFWIDFLDTEGVLQQYSTKKIGARQKVITDTKLKSITYNKVPNIIYCKNIGENVYRADYSYINMGTQYENMFSISAQGKSLQENLNELVNTHSFCIESATINAIPIYYLEPNSRISLSNRETGLNDIYSINKITLPLVYNGQMSITANKIYEPII